MGSEASSSAARQRALCILGMHRSGTSAVTRSFNLLGAFVGDEGDLMRETPANPEGYWERNDIYDFHERLLAAARRRWDTGLVLPDGWHRSPEMAPFREELRRIVSTVFAGRPLWAWKDPRTCILLDLWKEILDELGTDLVAAVVVRHPRDVAASLGRRDGFGMEKSCGVWFSHTLAALRSVEGVRTAFIGYDDFLEDPVGQVRRCAAALGLPPPDGADEACAAIGKFVRKDLRHSRAAADALEALPAPVRELYALVRRAMEHPASCDGAFFGRIRGLHREYSGYAGFFREDLEQCLAAVGRLDELEARCREQHARARAAEQEASEAGRRALLAEERALALDRQRLEAARALEEIVTSRIWRITGPVRKVADILRGKTGPARPPDR
jgi:hypothetical protein